MSLKFLKLWPFLSPNQSAETDLALTLNNHCTLLIWFHVPPSEFTNDSFLLHYSFLFFFLCYNLLLVLLLLSFFDVGVLFLSSQFLQVSLLAFLLFSVCVPILNFLFFHGTGSTFSASALTISHVNSRLQPYSSSRTPCSFRTARLWSCYSLYLHGPFLLWLPDLA